MSFQTPPYKTYGFHYIGDNERGLSFDLHFHFIFKDLFILFYFMYASVLPIGMFVYNVSNWYPMKMKMYQIP